MTLNSVSSQTYNYPSSSSILPIHPSIHSHTHYSLFFIYLAINLTNHSSFHPPTHPSPISPSLLTTHHRSWDSWSPSHFLSPYIFGDFRFPPTDQSRWSPSMFGVCLKLPPTGEFQLFLVTVAHLCSGTINWFLFVQSGSVICDHTILL